MRILIVEDNVDIATNLYDYLGSCGHVVDSAPDGVSGLHLAVTNEYDAILLDLTLPGLDGLSLCQKLREDAKRDTPVLMLTARDTLESKLEGFAHGADDYLIKPFALREVEARLLALNKRHTGHTTTRVLRVGDLTYDPNTLAVVLAGKTIKLPPKCMRMLDLMMNKPNRVFSRTELENAIWGDTQPNSDTLRSHIHILRNALTRPDKPDMIETVHGLGYRLKDSTEEP
jgi:DNA-binding response OmpR family regulator